MDFSRDLAPNKFGFTRGTLTEVSAGDAFFLRCKHKQSTPLYKDLTYETPLHLTTREIWLTTLRAELIYLTFPLTVQHSFVLCACTGNVDSSVGIENSYGLDGRGLIPGRSKIIPQRPDRL
jgi:hypothetical protein